MMIYLVYLGASVGVKYGNHIAVEFLSTMLPKKGAGHSGGSRGSSDAALLRSYHLLRL